MHRSTRGADLGQQPRRQPHDATTGRVAPGSCVALAVFCFAIFKFVACAIFTAALAVFIAARVTVSTGMST